MTTADSDSDSSCGSFAKRWTTVCTYPRSVAGFSAWRWILIATSALGWLAILAQGRSLFRHPRPMQQTSEDSHVLFKYFPFQQTVPFKQVLYALDMERKLLHAQFNSLALAKKNQRLRIEEEKVGLAQVQIWPDLATMFGNHLIPTLRSTRRTFLHLYKAVRDTSGKILSTIGAGSYDGFERQREKSAIINRLLTTNMVNLSDTFLLWRMKKARETEDDFQRRLHQIQNPDDCREAKKLVCDILRESCGFGCLLHYGITCLAASFALNRTMILRLGDWEYTTNKWVDYFVPPSPKCQWTPIAPGQLTIWRNSSHDAENTVLYPLNIYALQYFKPFRVEKSFADRLSHFHGRPWIWWIGQLLRNLFQVQPDFEKFYQKRIKLVGFKSPIVGIHVRRSDKIASEAKPYELEKYMEFVEEYYNKLELVQKVDQRRVFLASDAPYVYSEFRTKYPHYTLLHNQAAAKSSARKATRRSEDSLRGIMADMYFLAQTDHLVCTMSSNVCRVAYGLLQTRFPDASTRYDSLDVDYIYVGAVPHFHTAIHPHNFTTAETSLTFEVGDLIRVKETFWNGLSSGVVVGNHSDDQLKEPSRTFPAYKLIENVEVY